MYRVTHKHLALLAAVTIAIILVGCHGGGTGAGPTPGPTPGPSPTDVVGEWMYQAAGTTVSSQQDGTSGPPPYVNIKDDGTYRFEWSQSVWEEGNWTTSDGQITFTPTDTAATSQTDSGNTLPYEIDGNRLIITEGQDQYDFIFLADSVPTALVDKWLGEMDHIAGHSVVGIDVSADGSYTGTEAMHPVAPTAAPAQDDGPDIYWQQGTVRASVEDDLLVMPQTFSQGAAQVPYSAVEYQLTDGNNELQLSRPGASTNQILPDNISMFRKTDIPDLMANLWLRVDSQQDGQPQPKYSRAWMVLLIESDGQGHISGYDDPEASKMDEDIQLEAYVGNRLALVEDSGDISNIPVSVMGATVAGGDTLTVTSTEGSDTYTETFKNLIDQPSASVGTWQVTDVQEAGAGSAQGPDITITINTGETYRYEEGPAPVEWEEGDVQFFADGYLAINPTSASYQDLERRWMAYAVSGNTMTLTTWEDDGGQHVTRTMTLAKQ